MFAVGGGKVGIELVEHHQIALALHQPAEAIAQGGSGALGSEDGGIEALAKAQLPQADADQQRTGGQQQLGMADPGQSRRHVSAGKGGHLILLEAQLSQGRLQFLTTSVHLEHVNNEAVLQAAFVEVEA